MSFAEFKSAVLNDYRICCESREASVLGRKEVLTGKAKFGIFGDGKEVAQVAMAREFRNGDFRAGYYRDQTFMFAAGLLTLREFFAQLYAHPDVSADPSSAGRQMNAHLATRSLDSSGQWKNLMEMKNSSSDISPIASHIPRLLGLAYASKFYRHNPALRTAPFKKFSDNGNEVAFGTIGDAGTAEGMFFESLNAAGVLQVPLVLSVWDDGFGISVPGKFQTTKENISLLLQGFRREPERIAAGENGYGFEILEVKGWDYPALCRTYEEGVKLSRTEHVPVLIHVQEMTQPQGHSTSGSHERYKTKERLQWEQDADPIRKMREWIREAAIASEEELVKIEEAAKERARAEQKSAWEAFQEPIRKEAGQVTRFIRAISAGRGEDPGFAEILSELNAGNICERRKVVAAAKKALRLLRLEDLPEKSELQQYLSRYEEENRERFDSCLFSRSDLSLSRCSEVKPLYSPDAALVDGRLVLRENFDAILAGNPQTLIFGEDCGKLGDVNQGLEGLQKKYGELRVFDTGIRELTIIGQAIGLAMRGLRPIAEIQYLDYLLYALQIMSDDLATLQYRTKGGQKAPVIIRTRGHRLEGIWHSGSPMGGIIHLCRGICVCVPRNMTQAAGFYNALLASDEPGLVIEPLNSYRLKEKMPLNPGEFRVPPGVPEVVAAGTDLTIVTYGPLVRMAVEAAKQLNFVQISAEVIDVQTLLPFDVHHAIVESLKRTNRVIFLDEDVPGGASAYMLQKVLEEQEGYRYLDSPPRTLTASEHRPAYGSDGDYFSKPNVEKIIDAAYALMHEADPKRFPALYGRQ